MRKKREYLWFSGGAQARDILLLFHEVTFKSWGISGSDGKRIKLAKNVKPLGCLKEGGGGGIYKKETTANGKAVGTSQHLFHYKKKRWMGPFVWTCKWGVWGGGGTWAGLELLPYGLLQQQCNVGLHTNSKVTKSIHTSGYWWKWFQFISFSWWVWKHNTVFNRQVQKCLDKSCCDFTSVHSYNEKKNRMWLKCKVLPLRGF